MRNLRGARRAWRVLLPLSLVALSAAGCATRQQFDGIEAGVAELKTDNEEISREIESLRGMILSEHDLILGTKADILAEISGLREQVFQMENRLTEGGRETFLEPMPPRAGTPGADAAPTDGGMAGGADAPVEEGVRVEEGAITPPGAGPATDVAPTGGERPENVAAADERVLYDTAFLDMTRGNYELAVEGFRTFIAGTGARQLRDNAQYWIGECYYAMGDLRQAIEEFERVVEDYPGGNKIPSALFKIGKCYFELGDSDAAARYFRSVIDGFPRSEEANLARDYLTEL